MAQEYFLEGAFRNIHTRLRTHAESVAFFGGGAREGSTIATVFDSLLAHLRSVVDVRCGFHLSSTVVALWIVISCCLCRRSARLLFTAALDV